MKNEKHCYRLKKAYWLSISENILLTLWCPATFGDLKKKTPKCMWLCAGITPFLSKDAASLLQCTRKKFFGWGSQIFCEWRHKWRTFKPPWPTLPDPGRQPLDGSISLKFLLENTVFIRV